LESPTRFQALVDPSVSAGTVQPVAASAAEDAPKPQALPADATNAPAQVSSAGTACVQLLLLLLLLAAAALL
jgi:hypothetical protein